mgnify:CR=1 FL=1
MQRKAFLAGLAAAALGAVLPVRANETLVVIAHASVRGDADALKRLYTGRAIELDGQPATPLHLATGSTVRRRFLAAVVQQTEEDYQAYWTVRRYVGKGAPPREFATAAELIEHVRTTPGAVGYIDPADLKPGLHVIWKR